jgi:hypothetical protein
VVIVPIAGIQPCLGTSHDLEGQATQRYLFALVSYCTGHLCKRGLNGHLGRDENKEDGPLFFMGIDFPAQSQRHIFEPYGERG